MLPCEIVNRVAGSSVSEWLDFELCDANRKGGSSGCLAVTNTAQCSQQEGGLSFGDGQ